MSYKEVSTNAKFCQVQSMNPQNQNLNNDEQVLELVLRPKLWEDYVGQDKIKTNLKLILDAAKQRGESCDHLLFYGQAGL